MIKDFLIWLFARDEWKVIRSLERTKAQLRQENQMLRKQLEYVAPVVPHVMAPVVPDVMLDSFDKNLDELRLSEWMHRDLEIIVRDRMKGLASIAYSMGVNDASKRP